MSRAPIKESPGQPPIAAFRTRSVILVLVNLKPARRRGLFLYFFTSGPIANLNIRKRENAITKKEGRRIVEQGTSNSQQGSKKKLSHNPIN